MEEFIGYGNEDSCRTKIERFTESADESGYLSISNEKKRLF
jgi:hypothetical protein